MVRKVILLCGALMLLGATSALALTTIDLTTLTEVTDGQGVIWNSKISAPTGTGVYQPFLREQHNDTEQAFNTDFDPVPLDGKAGIWTHSVQFSSLATVNIGGVDYYAFNLDINEPSGPNDNLISLDTFQIYESGDRALSSLAQVQASSKLFDMDAGGDQEVDMNGDLHQGSGTDDVWVYIPKSALNFSNANDYLYLYAAFGNAGGSLSSADGFEEWRVLQGPNTPPPPPPIPEPTTMVLFGSGLIGLVSGKLRKK